MQSEHMKYIATWKRAVKLNLNKKEEKNALKYVKELFDTNITLIFFFMCLKSSTHSDAVCLPFIYPLLQLFLNSIKLNNSNWWNQASEIIILK